MPQFTPRSGEGGWGAARADPFFVLTGAWRFEWAQGTAAELHALGVPTPAARHLRWCDPVDDAVVLGRAQPEAHVNVDRAAALGLAVARRLSGGGAVLVGPGQLVWADVVIPAGDPLWDADVGRAAWWVGTVWADVLAGLGVDRPQVHHGGLVHRPGSDRVCFAALGPGEVTVGARKVVGVAQRRTRAATLFQCAAMLRWEPDALVAVLADAPGAADLAGLAVGLDELAPAARAVDVKAAFAAALIAFRP